MRVIPGRANKGMILCYQVGKERLSRLGRERSLKVRMQCKRGIDKDRGAEVSIFPA